MVFWFAMLDFDLVRSLLPAVLFKLFAHFVSTLDLFSLLISVTLVLSGVVLLSKISECLLESKPFKT